MPIQEVQQFRCTIPAGTAQANPAVFPMALMTLDIEWIEWDVPAGPRGDVGFWIGSHGQPVIPFTEGPAPNWIVADDREAHWDTQGLATSGDWELRGYNIGLLPHTVTVRFGLAPPGPAGLGAITPSPDLSILNA